LGVLPLPLEPVIAWKIQACVGSSSPAYAAGNAASWIAVAKQPGAAQRRAFWSAARWNSGSP
jgi:hypothetical protein